MENDVKIAKTRRAVGALVEQLHQMADERDRWRRRGAACVMFGIVVGAVAAAFLAR